MKTEDYILIEALHILSKDIQSQDGVANACIAEAANRMKELLNVSSKSINFFKFWF